MPIQRKKKAPKRRNPCLPCNPSTRTTRFSRIKRNPDIEPLNLPELVKDTKKLNFLLDRSLMLMNADQLDYDVEFKTIKHLRKLETFIKPFNKELERLLNQ